MAYVLDPYFGGPSLADSVLADERKLVRRALITILFSSIFLQRFGVPFGSTMVPLVLFINLGVIIFLFLRGQLDIDPTRMALTCLFAAYAAGIVLFGRPGESWSSALFAVAVYMPFGLMLRPKDGLLIDCLRAFQSMMLLCAALGIAQFLLQFVVSSKLLFTFDDTLPAGILLENFATYQPIEYGSPISRSNGLVMLEPSIFSQFAAIAIVIEVLYFQRAWRVGVYLLGALLSFSGTGLIALSLIPPILIGRKAYGMAAALVLFAGIGMVTSTAWHMDAIQQRASEYEDTNSSGYARFVAPWDLLTDYFIPEGRNILFGAGPGTMRDYQDLMPYQTHDPAWAKVLVEYGIIGSALFWPLFLLSVFVRSPSFWLSLALAIGFIAFGGEFLDPRLQALLLVFAILPKGATVDRPAFIRQRPATAHAL